MEWEQAGEAWGDRALDWAYLFEPYARAANDDVFDQVGVGPGVRLLDVACGSGYAAMVAAQRGAEVSGLDAATGLIEIARRRTPGGDFRVGDMFDLPFADADFDAVTSFNGIWAGSDAALVGATRVLRPGGSLGVTFGGALVAAGAVEVGQQRVDLLVHLRLGTQPAAPRPRAGPRPAPRSLAPRTR